jgi:hypothetical protein
MNKYNDIYIYNGYIFMVIFMMCLLFLLYTIKPDQDYELFHTLP